MFLSKFFMLVVVVVVAVVFVVGPTDAKVIFLLNLFLFTLWLALLTTNLEDSRRCCSCCSCCRSSPSSSWLVLFQLFSLLE